MKLNNRTILATLAIFASNCTSNFTAHSEEVRQLAEEGRSVGASKVIIQDLTVKASYLAEAVDQVKESVSPEIQEMYFRMIRYPPVEGGYSHSPINLEIDRATLEEVIVILGELSRCFVRMENGEIYFSSADETVDHFTTIAIVVDTIEQRIIGLNDQFKAPEYGAVFKKYFTRRGVVFYHGHSIKAFPDEGVLVLTNLAGENQALQLLLKLIRRGAIIGELPGRSRDTSQ